MLHYQDRPYLLKIIRIDIISRYYDNPLTGHFEVEKTKELVVRKYYWPTLQADIDVYVKGCDVHLASKVVWHKPYRNLQSLSVLRHYWKNLSMDLSQSYQFLQIGNAKPMI